MADLKDRMAWALAVALVSATALSVFLSPDGPASVAWAQEGGGNPPAGGENPKPCDHDQDGVPEDDFRCNTDQDPEPDECYVCDNDGDGTLDSCHRCDTNNDGKADACFVCDKDEDGTKDSCRNCNLENGVYTRCSSRLANMTDIRNCPQLQENPQPSSGPNGCSSPLGDDPCGQNDTSFLNACNNHDDCWDHCATTAQEQQNHKQECDTVFLQQMTDTCTNAGNPNCGGNLNWTCQQWANQYFNTVTSQAGDGYYENAQKDRCVCCDDQL